MCLLSRTEQGWGIGIHERIFDYLVFVTPLKPGLVMGVKNIEQKKIYVSSHPPKGGPGKGRAPRSHHPGKGGEIPR